MKLLNLAYYGSLVLLTSCGSKPNNINVDNDQLRDSYYSEAAGKAQTDAWQKISQLLGIPKNLAVQPHEVSTWLAQAPSIYTNRRYDDAEGSSYTLSEGNENFNVFNEKVFSKLAASAIDSQCASIEGISTGDTALGTTFMPVNARYHYIKYRLYGADGVAETIDRYGIVTFPNQDGVFPLLMYAHGDVKGLSYRELASSVGTIQQDTVVAAPTFSGERLCATGSDGGILSCHEGGALASASTPQTGADIWNGDVREFLGLQNCVTKAMTDTEATIDLLSHSDLSVVEENSRAGQQVFAKVGTVSIDSLSPSPFSAPYVLFAGADRGGLVSQLAAAKAGFFIYDQSQGERSLIAAYQAQLGSQLNITNPYPIGLVNIGSNFSMTLGLNRIALQYMVGGLLSQSAFAAIPGYTLLEGFFSRYSQDPALSIADAAAEIALRDMVYMAKFLPVSLRNWHRSSETEAAAKGQVLTLHGIDNLVVPYSQAQATDMTHLLVNQGVAAAPSDAAHPLPGYRHAVYAFQADDTYYEPCGSEPGEVFKAACANEIASGGDGYIWKGTQADAPDYNHVADLSFLNSKLVSLTPHQRAIVTQAESDSSIDSYSDCIASQSGLPPSFSEAMLAPLFARDAADSVYRSGYNKDALVNATPAAIIVSFFTFHRAALNGIANCTY